MMKNDNNLFQAYFNSKIKIKSINIQMIEIISNNI